MKTRFATGMFGALTLGVGGCAAPSGTEPSAIGMANPASAYCASQGGTLEIRKGLDGESGYCHLPDGRVVEEWEFYRAQTGNAGSAAPASGDTSRNALDWAGTYRGVIPCADCEGIETIVTLKEDGSYTSSSHYLGKWGEPSAEEGRFQWDEAGGAIRLSGGEPARYRVGENRLIRLALDGSPITGALADHYVLTKMTGGLTETRWNLVELNGRPVPALESAPHLIIKAEGSRVTGYSGCNGFSGSYTLDETALRIRFGQLVMTQRACAAGMDVERDFAAALERADSYALTGDRLTLNRARMAPLARFEAVRQR